MPQTAYIFLIMTLVLFLALFLGRLAARFRIPKVTGYLLAGMLAGPSLHNWIHGTPILTRAALGQLQFLIELGLALIVLTIGLEFKTEHFKRWGRRILILSGTEIAATFLLTLALTWMAGWWLPSLGGLWPSLTPALFFGIIAVATAPAATLFVMREYEAEGPMTESLFMLIGLNNLAAVAGFILVSYLMFQSREPVALLGQLGLPVAIGGGTGFVLAMWAQRIDREREFQLLLLGGVVLLIGLCDYARVNMMLAAFFAGVVLTNASPKAAALLGALQKIDYPIYVIFFVLSGANMHLETLGGVGLLGIAYIAARTAGKFVGSRLGARWGGFKETEQTYLGFTLIAQAGVAIGLCRTLCRAWPEGGAVVETVILGSLIVFELAGPLAVRYGLVQAGEVSLLSLLVKKAPANPFQGFHQVIDHFRDALGIPAHREVGSAADILVKHVMRQNVETVPDTTDFNEFLHIIAYSRYDRFPIVDHAGRFLGVVDYSDIRDMLFDPSLAHLIIVRDLVKSDPLVVHAEQPVSEVIGIFTKHPNISYLPVVDAQDAGKLVGILSQNTVLSLFRSLEHRTAK